MVDVPVRVVGRGADAYVSVLWRIGALGHERLRLLWRNVVDSVGDIDFGVDATPRATPGGVAVDLMVERAEQIEQVCIGLQNLRQTSGPTSDGAAPPVRSPAELVDSIVFGGVDLPVDPTPLSSVPVAVAVTTGRSAHPDPTGYATTIRDRCLAALGEGTTQPGPLVVDSSTATSSFAKWIHLPHQTSSLVRWYRELSSPADTATALARSLGNACIGGTPSSRAFRLLSEQRRYSYNPSIYLRQVNGRQWMVVDVPTASGSEVLVENELRRLFLEACDTPPTQVEVEEAVGFMFTQKRVVWESPQLANFAALAPYDGSDPWALTNVPLADALAVSLEAVAEQVRMMYDATDLLRVVVSPLAEPESWSEG